jgi:hypothetical protein
MGKWFPDIRKGTPEQVRAYIDAHKALFRNGTYESNLRTADGRRAIRDETPRYLDLNSRAYYSGAPLSRTQQWWHWHRALTEEDRDFTRLQRASERQDRAMRTTRGRSR